MYAVTNMYTVWGTLVVFCIGKCILEWNEKRKVAIKKQTDVTFYLLICEILFY